MNEPFPAPAEHSQYSTALGTLKRSVPKVTKRAEPVRSSLAPASARSKVTNPPEAEFFALARSVEERDPNLGSHCRRLALMSSAIGMLLDLPADDIRVLSRAGYLHDIGKVDLPDSILLKPGPLTSEEWELMKTHPVRGEEICSAVPSLKPLLPIIRHHHENWDGSGYPDGLQGNRIPLLARVVQLADIYDALTSQRSYKAAFSSDEAIQIMKAETLRGLRDPNLMPVMEAALPIFRSEPFWQTAPFSLAALSTSLSAGS